MRANRKRGADALVRGRPASAPLAELRRTRRPADYADEGVRATRLRRSAFGFPSGAV